MTSDSRIAANRENAKLSTGPRTDAGKAASSMNAVKHGLTAERIAIIPGEDPQVYHDDLQAWLSGCDADPLLMSLAERGCRAAWQLRRLGIADDARIACQVRSAADRFDLDQLHRAHELGEKLLFDPRTRDFDGKNDPESLRHTRGWEAIEPALIAAALETFAEGADWMIARWTELSVLLEQEQFWDYDARFRAVKLMGKRPENVLRDADIRAIMHACLATQTNTAMIDEAYQETVAKKGLSVYFYRTILQAENPFPTPLAGYTALKALVKAELERLTARKRDVLDARADADRAEAPLRAFFDAGPAAALRLRYETHLDRTLRSAILELNKARRAGPARPYCEPVAASQVTIGKPVEDETSEWNPGPGRPLRNEANPWPVSDDVYPSWEGGMAVSEAPPGPG